MIFNLATWNINSIRLRVDLVCKLLKDEQIDILCLQECKSPVDKIPFEAFSKFGFKHMVARGQKGYNGVAIISKSPLKEKSAIDFAGLGHARHISAELENGIIIHNFYVPASILSLSTQSIMWMPHMKSQIRHCRDLMALTSPENGSTYTFIFLPFSFSEITLYSGKLRPLNSEPRISSSINKD